MIPVLVFILGALVGSFENSVIYRLDNIESIIKARSHCPHCKAQLKPWDLIPILSFILLYGRCRYCKKEISWQYPLVEAGTAIIFLALYTKFGLSWETVFLALISAALIVIFVYDLKKQLIPDEILIPAAILTILWLLANFGFGGKLNILTNQSLSSNLWGLLFGGGLFGILVAVSKEKWMGVGDVKLGALLGLILGSPLILVVLFFAFILGSASALLMLSLGKKHLTDQIPFGPYLIIASYIAIFWGEKIIGWYLGRL